jgi:bile acid:Na+ symporter, BASS family
VRLTLDAVIFGLTAATMLVVGLELEISKIPDLARRKLLLPGLLLSQMMLLPALGILVIHAVPMSETTKILVLMLSASPIGNIANFFTLLARGNLALSVSASACSCLLAPIVIPLTFALYGQLPGGAFPFMVPSGTLLARIFALTWAPILLGIGLRSIRSNNVARFSLLLQAACATGIVALCVFICVTRAGQLATDLKTNVTVSAMLILATLAGAAGMSRVLRLAARDAVCYMTAFPARNIGVLAVITVTTLHRFNDLVFILVYFVLETVVMLAVVAAYRWRSSLRALPPRAFGEA